MEIKNTFEVAAPIDKMWELLIDVEAIAPCIPGFQLQEIEGNEYRGVMKLKVGAVVMEYAGRVNFVELDEEHHRVVMTGGGNERRGGGTVDANVVSELTTLGDRTRVDVVASLDVTGKIAGFGRSIMQDVSERLVAQFVRCLETRVLDGSSA